jgi:hypothetical protein
MKALKNINVYYQSSNETELIGSFETIEQGIETANYPGFYWNLQLGSDSEAFIEVTNSMTGETIYTTSN